MERLIDYLSSLNIEHMIALVALSAIMLAGFAIYVIFVLLIREKEK